MKNEELLDLLGELREELGNACEYYGEGPFHVEGDLLERADKILNPYNQTKEERTKKAIQASEKAERRKRTCSFCHKVLGNELGKNQHEVTKHKTELSNET